MAYIEVEVEIDEFDSDELVSEVISRVNSKWKSLSDSQIEELKEAIQVPGGAFKGNSIIDTIKYEHLSEVFNQYTLEEIREALPNKMFLKAV